MRLLFVFEQQTTPNPFLANGPAFNRVNFGVPQQSANIFGAIPTLSALQAVQPLQFPVQTQTQFRNGQYSSAQRLIQAQFTQPPASTPSPTAPVLFPRDPQQIPTIPESITSPASFVNLNNPANVQFIDDAPQSFGNRALFKRNRNSAGAAVDTAAGIGSARKVVKVKRFASTSNDKKNNKKRALVALSDGSIIDDENIADDNGQYDYDGLSQFGAANYQDGSGGKNANIEDEIKEHDREPAENEVKAVLAFCSSCQTEPFAGAVAFAWKGAKVIAEKTLNGRSVGGCFAF